MCVYSMVSDHYEPIIPWAEPYQPWESGRPFTVSPVSEQDLKKVLQDFAEAMKAAKTVDDLTGQPNCVDPEKAKLEQRVKELEELLASGVEFVLIKRQNMQPGKYRVLDGKLHRVFE